MNDNDDDVLKAYKSNWASSINDSTRTKFKINYRSKKSESESESESELESESIVIHAK